jgi:hypothetical protein
VVEVVFQKVVFRQVGDVAGLDRGEERDVRRVGAEGEDVHHVWAGGECACESGALLGPDSEAGRRGWKSSGGEFDEVD